MPSVSLTVPFPNAHLIIISRQPVHGLIFLYRYQEDEEDEDKEMKDPPPCSNHVWFANQVSTQNSQE